VLSGEMVFLFWAEMLGPLICFVRKFGSRLVPEELLNCLFNSTIPAAS